MLQNKYREQKLLRQIFLSPTARNQSRERARKMSDTKTSQELATTPLSGSSTSTVSTVSTVADIVQIFDCRKLAVIAVSGKFNVKITNLENSLFLVESDDSFVIELVDNGLRLNHYSTSSTSSSASGLPAFEFLGERHKVDTNICDIAYGNAHESVGRKMVFVRVKNPKFCRIGCVSVGGGAQVIFTGSMSMFDTNIVLSAYRDSKIYLPTTATATATVPTATSAAFVIATATSEQKDDKIAKNQVKDQVKTGKWNFVSALTAGGSTIDLGGLEIKTVSVNASTESKVCNFSAYTSSTITASGNSKVNFRENRSAHSSHNVTDTSTIDFVFYN